MTDADIEPSTNKLPLALILPATFIWPLVPLGSIANTSFHSASSVTSTELGGSITLAAILNNIG